MTPKERAAMQQALGALVRAEAMYGQPNTDIQTALREALAVSEQRTEEQPKQEPVACPVCCNGYLVKRTEEYCNSCGSVCVSPQTIQENVTNKKAAPVRTKDLTDDELREIHHLDQFGLFCDYDDFEQIARAVIAADRGKNK